MTWEQLVQRLLEDGKVLASEIFKITLRQVYVVAISDLAWGIALLIVAIASWLYLRKYLKHVKEFNAKQENRYEKIDIEDSPSFWISLILGIFSTLISLGLINCAIFYMSNPNWYAAKWLLEDIIRISTK